MAAITPLEKLVKWLEMNGGKDIHHMEGVGANKEDQLQDGINKAKVFADKMRENVGDQNLVKIEASYNRVIMTLVQQPVGARR